jgi:hypothetical protein
MNTTSPRPLWKRLEHAHVKPLLRRLKPWRQASFGGIAVSFKTHLDGGDSSFGQNFVPFLRERGVPRLGRVFEWCAGPGFIGFSLLGHGLCDSLCLADINPEAVAACECTIAKNGLAGRVSVYRSDNLDGIPSAERWDLVVGNPLHFDDDGSGIHRRFFASVGRHLVPGGLVLLQENNAGSTAEDFRPLIEAAGLSLLFVSGGEPVRTPELHIYFIGISTAGDTPPTWTKALTRDL